MENTNPMMKTRAFLIVGATAAVAAATVAGLPDLASARGAGARPSYTIVHPCNPPYCRPSGRSLGRPPIKVVCRGNVCRRV